MVDRARVHGFWHVWWTRHFCEYSPGLRTSILVWMNLYFIVRYRPADEPILANTLWPAIMIGLVAASFLSFYIPLIKGNAKKCEVH
jgi:hypothetical protein